MFSPRACPEPVERGDGIFEIEEEITMAKRSISFIPFAGILALCLSLVVPTVYAVTVTPRKYGRGLEQSIQWEAAGGAGKAGVEDRGEAQLCLPYEEWPPREYYRDDVYGDDPWYGELVEVWSLGQGMAAGGALSLTTADPCNWIAFMHLGMLAAGEWPVVWVQSQTCAIENLSWFSVNGESGVEGYAEYEITSDTPWQLFVLFWLWNESYWVPGFWTTGSLTRSVSLNGSIYDSDWNLIENFSRSFSSYGFDEFGDLVDLGSGTYYVTVDARAGSGASMWGPCAPREAGQDPGSLCCYSHGYIYALPNGPPDCVIQLQKDGTEIDKVDVGEFFDIFVGYSTDDWGITAVRFSSDDVQDGIPTGTWSDWCQWDTSSGDWNAASKTKAWSFATAGDKEVWAEVKDFGGMTDNACANIFAVSPMVPPEKRVVIFLNENEVDSDFSFKKTNLEYGISHEDVRKLQLILKHEGFFPLGVSCTGNYLGITKDAVASFQRDRALGEQDGIVGDETVVELNKILGSKCTLYTSRASLICEYVEQFIRSFLPDYFPPEIVLAVAAVESGDNYFDNMYLSGDCGRGIMQITSEGYFGLGSGIGCSDVDCVQCGVENCNFYYKNTICGIEANIKDGLAALMDKYNYALQCPQNSIVTEEVEITYEDLKMIITVWGYNGFGDSSYYCTKNYLRCVADRFERLSDYFPGEIYANGDNLIEKLRWANDNKQRIILHSPAVLSVIDGMGRATGAVAGQTKDEIPGSIYDPDSGQVIILFPEQPLIYRVAGTSQGMYGLSIDSTENGTFATFKANNIPTSPGTVHEYRVDWDALSVGEKAVVLKVDADGDGIFEKTVIANNYLTSDEFALQTETVIDFEPDTLNLKSKGKWVTVYIELPVGHGYDVSMVHLASIMLNDQIQVEAKPIEIGDYDSDGVHDLMVKFDRQQVIQILKPGEQTVTLTGCLTDGRLFAGTDVVRVIH